MEAHADPLEQRRPGRGRRSASARLLIVLVPGLLAPREPEPLPADVGLATGGRRRLRLRRPEPRDGRAAARGRRTAAHSPARRGDQHRRRSCAAPTQAERSRAGAGARARRTCVRARVRARPGPGHRAGAGLAIDAGSTADSARARRRRRISRTSLRPPDRDPPADAAPAGRRTAARARASSASSTDARSERCRIAEPPATPRIGSPAARDRDRAADRRRDGAAARTAARDAGSYVVTECSSVRPGAGEASWERTSDHYRGRSRCGTRRRPAGLPRRGRVRALALRRLGLARAGRAPCSPACRRTPASPTRPGHRGQLVVDPARGRAGRVRRRARRLPRPLDRRRVHPVSQLAALRRPGRRQAVRARRRRQRPRLRPRRLPAHRGPRRADRRAQRRLAARRPGRPRGAAASASRAADAGGGIRRVYVEANGAPLRDRRPQLRARRGLRDRAAPLPARRGEPRPRCRPPTPPSPPARTRSPPASRTWRSTARPTAPASRAAIWVDNACPGSAVAGGAGSAPASARAAGRPRCARTGARSCSGRVAGAGGAARPSAR